ncbi:hypothetical protein [Guggenheimella bovis]
MKLFDTLIQEMLSFFGKDEHTTHPYSEKQSWKELGHSELVLSRDAAFELGGGDYPSVNCTYVTSNGEFVPADEIVVYGQPLERISSDTSFVRMAILLVDDTEQNEEESYNMIKQLDFIRYNVHPEGYMVRVSSESNQEKVRVSKAAKNANINFFEVGNSYINKYKENPKVKRVRLIFATGYKDLSPLKKNVESVHEVTKALTEILDGLIADCSKCSMKPVCDTVDGLREMHMSKVKGGSSNA